MNHPFLNISATAHQPVIATKQRRIVASLQLPEAVEWKQLKNSELKSVHSVNNFNYIPSCQKFPSIN